ncbi:NAD(P)-binding protein [Dothidotthia symphoricarpi CBS 119687]|uniref:NAD(P)-binding protein n=1 Tax=Dothidotthia symphoricarpi CBS 119687 TaxID=1392245 RepID=A0A6A6A6E9_9PLEO|nr:NAD(P)-binding protein [Dothidotthia symphoricarpi CBS 119687]KAF2127459.1 NAD(P)-binding protein [Dothidotthia symphoricarpi CBS 119687]
MAARPTHSRTVSTNLGTSSSSRVLQGRLAIVTGASRGIGVEIARNLASKGSNIVLNYTSDSSTKIAEDLAAELQSEYDVKAIAVQASMGSETGPKHLIEIAKNNFQHPKTGKFQLDIIINNAGVAGNNYVENVDCEDFARQFNINVRGPLLLLQAAIPYLPNDRSGRIVSLSSVSSSLGYKGQSIYGGTKAALESMTRTWSRELSERCTVNTVNPGPVATDMYWGNDEAFIAQNKPFIENTPLATPRKGIDPERIYEASQNAGGRPAYSEEVAGVVGMLCLPEAGWTTGSVICANGGMKFSV